MGVEHTHTHPAPKNESIYSVVERGRNQPRAEREAKTLCVPLTIDSLDTSPERSL